MNLLEINPKKILIRSTNWIGDAIMTTPAVRSIRENFPDAEISILVLPWVSDVFNASPHVDEVLLYNKKDTHKGFGGMWRLSRSLRDKGFDMAILLQNAFEAAFLARLAGIPVRAGYKRDGRAFLLSHGVRLKKDIKKLHQVYYYQNLLRNLGLVPGKNELFLSLPDNVSSWALEYVRGLGDGPVIGLNPGAAYGPAKRWPSEKFGRFARAARDRLNASFLVFGTRDDTAAAETIKGFVPEGVADVTGKTSLAEAMALIGACDAFVTNDSGLMHVGAALNTPLVAIFGSTNPVTTGPYSNSSIVIRKGLPCSPCLRETCPTDFECMMGITEEEVLEAVDKLLQPDN